MAPRWLLSKRSSGVESGHDAVGMCHAADSHRHVKKRRRPIGVRFKEGTGWSFVVGLLLGLLTASFVSFLFVSNF